MPSPQDILSIRSDQIAAFIQEHTAQKTLSTLVKQLNDMLMYGDEAARHLAARALRHLGFPDYA